MVSDQAACEKAGGVWVSDGQGGGFCYMKLEGEDIEIDILKKNHHSKIIIVRGILVGFVYGDMV